MTSAQQTLKNLESRFHPKASAGQTIVFQFDITDENLYVLSVKNSELEMYQGLHESPDLTLTLDSDTLTQLISGKAGWYDCL